jgi:hypothetical protein
MRKEAFKQAFEKNSMGVALEALGKSIVRWTDKGNQLMTAIPGLSLSWRDKPTQHMYGPIICMIAQGAKRVLLADETYVFDAHH